MQRLQKPSKETRQLFNQEWKRAKKLLAPALDDKKKPLLYVKKTLKRNWVGYHSGGGMTIAFKINGRWVQGSHKIVLKTGIGEDKKTIRHEICHIVHQNHKAGFKNLLSFLNRE